VELAGPRAPTARNQLHHLVEAALNWMTESLSKRASWRRCHPKTGGVGVPDRGGVGPADL